MATPAPLPMQNDLCKISSPYPPVRTFAARLLDALDAKHGSTGRRRPWPRASFRRRTGRNADDLAASRVAYLAAVNTHVERAASRAIERASAAGEPEPDAQTVADAIADVLQSRAHLHDDRDRSTVGIPRSRVEHHAMQIALYVLDHWDEQRWAVVREARARGGRNGKRTADWQASDLDRHLGLSKAAQCRVLGMSDGTIASMRRAHPAYPMTEPQRLAFQDADDAEYAVLLDAVYRRDMPGTEEAHPGDAAPANQDDADDFERALATLRSTPAGLRTAA